MRYTALKDRILGAADAVTHCICGAPLELLVQRGMQTRRDIDGFVADLRHCHACDHVQFAPLPDERWLERYLKNHEFWTAAPAHPMVYIEQWSTLLPQTTFLNLVRKQAAKWTAKTVRIHDFGCGYGGLVNRLRGDGYDATGSDLSSECIKFARDDLGLPAWNGGIEELKKLSLQHVITGYHVAEHIRDPEAFFDAAVNALEPDGYLVLAFPNGAYAPAWLDYFGRFDWVIFPDHIHYYTPKSIKLAFQRHGLEVVSIESNSDSERVTQIGWLLEVVTGGRYGGDVDPTALLEFMDRSLQSRDLRIVGSKSAAKSRPSIAPNVSRMTNYYPNEGTAEFILSNLDLSHTTPSLTLTAAAKSTLPPHLSVVLDATPAEGPVKNLGFWPSIPSEKWFEYGQVHLTVPLIVPPGKYDLTIGLWNIDTHSLHGCPLVTVGQIRI